MGNKKILVSQKLPGNMTPYTSLSEKFGVDFEFKPFFSVEPLSSREFRAQHINILDYTAVVFSSRHAIDAFFTLAGELRIKIPETMKYFCTTEAVAVYLQKHIVFRKRKIFYGEGSADSLVAQITPKHVSEKFLVVTSDSSRSETLTTLLEENGIEFTTGVFVKSVIKDISDTDLHSFDIVVVYNSNDIASIQSNFPDFEQKDIKFICYGKHIRSAMEDAGFSVTASGPTPDCPSAVKTIESYLTSNA